MSSNFPPSFVWTPNGPTVIQLDTHCDSTTLTFEPALFSTIDPSSIAKLVETKDQTWLRGQGGVEGLVSALHTHEENGIEGNNTDIDNRCRVFGSNFYVEDKPAKKFHHFGLEALKHPMIIILLVCAVLSVCFGIKENGWREGWCEGVAKLVAILIAVTISAVSNFLPHRLCHQLSEASSQIPQVDVVRTSQWQRISIPRIVVGDIVFLKPGDLVPADGLCLSGCSLQVRLTSRPRRIRLIPSVTYFKFAVLVIDLEKFETHRSRHGIKRYDLKENVEYDKRFKSYHDIAKPYRTIR